MAQSTDEFWEQLAAAGQVKATWARRLRWWASAKLQVMSWRIGRAAARLAR